MTINTTPTMPTAVDQQADFFMEQFVDRISPIEHWVGHMHGGKPFAKISEQHKIATLTIAVHAAEFGTFDTTFKHRRVILQALRLATGRLTTTENPEPSAQFRAVYAGMVGKLARLLAATYVEYPEV